MFHEFKRFTIRKGTGKNDISALNSIDSALSDAGVGDYNLIRVSSLIPKDMTKTDEIDAEFGSFLPCVLAEAVGAKYEVAAGIGYGLDSRGRGYVAEHSICSDGIDMESFDADLKEKVVEMGRIREIDIEDIKIDSVKTDIYKGEFGCAIAVLVYLP